MIDNNVEQAASELSVKIKELVTLDGDSLKTEMASLKKAIMDNPAACSLLHDEDIGAAVAALRRMVGVAVATASAPKEKKTSKAVKKLTAAELAVALQAVGDEDFS